jgi:hypothetical protein
MWSSVDLNVAQSMLSALNEDLIEHMAFNVLSPKRFLFFVFMSLTTENSRSASAFECGSKYNK